MRDVNAHLIDILATGEMNAGRPVARLGNCRWRSSRLPLEFVSGAGLLTLT
jgi:hypothetical protein